MIDNARALRDQAQSRLDSIAAEAEGLQAVIEALDGFIAGIEQPSADPSDRQGGAPSVAPVPDREDPPAVSQPGSARSDGGTGPKGAPTPASYPCPEPGCSVVGKTFAGLGVHRARAHKDVTPPPAPATNGKTSHPSHSEKFLCSRNCGASFLSRRGVDEHEAEGTCRPKPTPPPSGLAPLGSLGGPTRSAGFGQ